MSDELEKDGTAKIEKIEGTDSEKIEAVTDQPYTLGMDKRPEALGEPGGKSLLAPEEEAWAPQRANARRLPRGVIFAAIAALVVVFCAGGTVYYRESILPERLFLSASRLFENGEYAEAVKIYEKVLNLKPDRRGLLFRIGYSHEMLGDDIDAIDAYAAHVKNESSDAEALLRLGSLYFRNGLQTEALAALEKLEGRASTASVDYMLGSLRESTGNRRMASESYKKANLSGTDAELLYTASMALMRLGYYQDALDGFTRMGEFAESGDMRSFHSSNAAKAMLGWPTDPAHVITPGGAVGRLALGAVSGDVLAEWGMPLERTSEGEHSIWGYGGSSEELETLVYMENDTVIEIVTSAKKYKTLDGLGIANFLEPKYADKFDRWRATQESTEGSVTLFRYDLKDGGLAFYSVDGYGSAVIFYGDQPLSSVDGYEWAMQK
ncbi:MAG: tetratricopeptide repeat protein [Synergistaceae bacterium]|nr:tetratricopeptide repeat protein [Synergistaceae bacterium]